LTISGDLIREKARRFAAHFGIPPDDFLSLSNGWLESFKACHGLRDVRFYGEAGDVLNWDESGLLYRARPTRGLAMSSHPGVKVDKTRITVAFLVNATGSDMPQPLIIGKARRPRAFKKRDGTQLGFDYWWNSKAWMTGSIFSSWLERLDLEMRQQGRHILLLVDNASSHKYNPSKIHNIRVEFLPPNMTSRVQPLDAGIIRTFKAHYRRLFLQRALDRDESGEADIYQINQLEAMHLIRDAWAHVSVQTVADCWAHTGILGDSLVPTAVEAVTHSGMLADSRALAALQLTIDEISAKTSSRDVVQAHELVGLPGEDVTEAVWTEEDVVNEVRKEQEETETTSDLDEGVETQDRAVPSVPEAMEEVRKLQKFFIDTRDDDPVVQQSLRFLLSRLELKEASIM
ncbi:hypothetical protein BOTBODRAFT_106185, partial [Botryobasidium botryosum FD-172 SS1]